eukprot:scaffold106645_cov51-Phaeocystis_antarctica.AAC.1
MGKGPTARCPSSPCTSGCANGRVSTCTWMAEDSIEIGDIGQAAGGTVRCRASVRAAEQYNRLK